MAEGVEETESNSNNNKADTPAMLGTVLPCEAAITASLGGGVGIKREFDATTLTGLIGGITSHLSAVAAVAGPKTTKMSASSLSSSSSSSSSCSSSSSTSSSLSSTSMATAGTTPAISSIQTTTKSPTRSISVSPARSNNSGDHHHTLANIKSEDYEKEISNHKIRTPDGDRMSSASSPTQAAVAVAAAAAAAAHLNGTMQDMINLQKLQNFASLQQQQQQQHHHHHHQQQQHHHHQHHHQKQQLSPTPSSSSLSQIQGQINTSQDQQNQQQQQQQHQQQQTSSVVAALASLQGLAGIGISPAAVAALNSPLNLSIASSNTVLPLPALPNNNLLTSNCNKMAAAVAAAAASHHVIHGSSSVAVGSASSSSIAPANTPTLPNNINNNLVGGCSSSSPNNTTNSSSISNNNNNNVTQMPQFILASGQLVQGVQGAQLLIPTAQGIAVQTVLTIPVSQQVNTNEQFLQSFAALNTGAAAAAAAAAAFNTQTTSHLHNQLLKPNFFQPGVQQLLAALHPELFSNSNATVNQMPSPKSLHLQQLQKQQQQHQQQQNQPHHQTERYCSSPKLDLPSHAMTHHQHQLSREASTSPATATSTGTISVRRLRSDSPTSIQLPKQSPSRLDIKLEKSCSSSSLNNNVLAGSTAGGSSPPMPSPNCYISPSGNSIFRNSSHSPPSLSSSQQSSHHINPTAIASHQHSNQSSAVIQSSPSSSSVLSNINRLTASNGELTITKSLGPGGGGGGCPSNSSATSHCSSSNSNANMNATITGPSISPPSHRIDRGSSNEQQQHHHHQQQQQQQLQHQQTMNAGASSSSVATTPNMKMSPNTVMQQMSPDGTDNSTADLLIDSPNEPTINQATSNVVDGIDLDEIKEFAKAFKLRRLSLGLTQTQVGQALSVTEGPAYSQSAICSALAAQMYAAQLSSQQQNMFEKLDITPKSAQKIKPVLERWMKEAEESHWNRYKSGQNHLTDFIGVEPSKKRKRRTSFTPQALELLNAHFERNTHPSGTEITGLAHQLGYEREVIRIWFCNKRQALKNTVRMMSKGMV